MTSPVDDEMVERACLAYVLAGGFVDGANRLGVEGPAMRAALEAALSEPNPCARCGHSPEAHDWGSLCLTCRACPGFVKPAVPALAR